MLTVLFKEEAETRERRDEARLFTCQEVSKEDNKWGRRRSHSYLHVQITGGTHRVRTNYNVNCTMLHRIHVPCFPIPSRPCPSFGFLPIQLGGLLVVLTLFTALHHYNSPLARGSLFFFSSPSSVL